MAPRIFAKLSTLAVAFVLFVAACDDSSAVKEPEPNPPGTVGDAGGGPVAADGGDAGPDCFTNPKTHFEIINACTNATKIAKNPVLPKLLPDGGLPPLN